eukprot:COSAG02_NODE_1451_length_12556_cov_3.624258_11_plen_93_part_00
MRPASSLSRDDSRCQALKVRVICYFISNPTRDVLNFNTKSVTCRWSEICAARFLLSDPSLPNTRLLRSGLAHSLGAGYEDLVAPGAQTLLVL